VVEERGRLRPGVVLRREMEDEGSMAVPSAGLNEVVKGGVGGDDNSGADDDSGEEEEGNVMVSVQKGGFTIPTMTTQLLCRRPKKGIFL
jgi:hypothetical protein